MLELSSILFHWNPRAGTGLQPTEGRDPVFTRSGVKLYWDGRYYRTGAVGTPTREMIRLGPSRLRGFLLAAAGTNLATRSNDPSHSDWTKDSGVTATALTDSEVFEGLDGYTVASNGGGAFHKLAQNAGSLTTSPETVSVVVEKGTSDVVSFGVFDSGALVSGLTYTWSTDALSAPAAGSANSQSRSRVVLSEEPGRVRLILSYDPTSGGTRDVRFYPVGYNRTASESTIWHHLQVQELGHATQPVVTTTASASDAADALYFRRAPVPQGLIVYQRIHLGMVDAGETTAMASVMLGQADSGARLKMELRAGNTLRARMANASNTVDSDISQATAYGDTLEWIAALDDSDGSLDSFTSIDEATPSHDASGALSGGMPAAWNGDGRLWANFTPGLWHHTGLLIVKRDDVEAAISSGGAQALLDELRTFHGRILPNRTIDWGAGFP